MINSEYTKYFKLSNLNNKRIVYVAEISLTIGTQAVNYNRRVPAE